MLRTEETIFAGDPLARSFGRAAERYHEHASVQRDMADWLAEWLPERREGSVLEIGAGPGTFTRRLFPWAGEVTATDCAEAMCAAGREAWPGARWAVMRAEAPLAGPWDWVVSSSALQWLDDPQAAFTALRGTMRGGGRALISLFTADTLVEWRSLAGERAPIRWRGAAEWRAALEAAGFRVVREEASARAYRYASARALLRSLHGVGAAPARGCAPARLRGLLAEYDREFACASRGVGATWGFYRCEAVAGEA